LSITLGAELVKSLAPLDIGVDLWNLSVAASKDDLQGVVGPSVELASAGGAALTTGTVSIAFGVGGVFFASGYTIGTGLGDIVDFYGGQKGYLGVQLGRAHEIVHEADYYWEIKQTFGSTVCGGGSGTPCTNVPKPTLLHQEVRPVRR
jgi:hypothetical protein